MATKVTTKSAEKLTQPITITALMTKVQKEKNYITPKDLEGLFNIEQPMVRRHLRSHFAEQFDHSHGTKWEMKTTEESTKTVVQYFYERFPIVLDEQTA